MKRLFMMLLLGGLVLSGCGNSGSGITQEQYESVIAERDKYKEGYESFLALQDDTTVQIQAESGEQEQDPEKDNNEPQKVNLIDSGWTSSKNGDYTHVYYCVEIENPNAEYAIQFPTITITSRDAEGKILKNDERVLNSIASGDTIIYGSDSLYEGAEPTTVDISVSNGKNDYAQQDNSKYAKTSDFVITNVSENKGSFNTKYTGELTNNSEIDLSNISVTVVYKKDGEYVGGSVGFVDNVDSGATKVFEISSDYSLEYDSYELYAIQW